MFEPGGTAQKGELRRRADAADAGRGEGAVRRQEAKEEEEEKVPDGRR